MIQGTLIKVCEACFLDPFKSSIKSENRKEAARLEERTEKTKSEVEQITLQSAEITRLIRSLEAELKQEMELCEAQKLALAQGMQAEESRGLILRNACDSVHKSIEDISIEEKALNERYLAADQLLSTLRNEFSEQRKAKNEAMIAVEQQARQFDSVVARNDLLEVVCERCREELVKCCCPSSTGYVVTRAKPTWPTPGGR
jgi:predicted  nucleic acid-binding Zn-ribbon protein